MTVIAVAQLAITVGDPDANLEAAAASAGARLVILPELSDSRCTTAPPWSPRRAWDAEKLVFTPGDGPPPVVDAGRPDDLLRPGIP
jgi:predicted amidohydrolase